MTEFSLEDGLSFLHECFDGEIWWLFVVFVVVCQTLFACV